MDETYTIYRSFFKDNEREDLEVGLTLEEAKAHFDDKANTSSRTATAPWAVALTAERGPWFDSYTAE